MAERRALLAACAGLAALLCAGGGSVPPRGERLERLRVDVENLPEKTRRVFKLHKS